MSGEAQQRRVEADRIPAPFEHSAFQIIVEQDAWYALKCLEGCNVPAQEVLHPGIKEEAQENLPRMAQHHHERHQRTPRTANLQVAEMGPVDLCLFARQAAQPQIRFGRTTRPVAGNEVAKVIRAAAVAALAHHRIQPAGGQGWELLQRLPDERQIRIRLR